MNRAWSIDRSPGAFPAPSERRMQHPDGGMKGHLDNSATHRFDQRQASSKQSHRRERNVWDASRADEVEADYCQGPTSKLTRGSAGESQSFLGTIRASRGGLLALLNEFT